MHPYNFRKLTESPDVGDIKEEGRKSSTGKYPEKGGEFKGYTRKSRNKRATRRYLKRADKAKFTPDEG